MIPNDRAFNGKNFFQENGKNFFRYERIEKKGKYTLKLKFIAVNSPYKQGIAIRFSRNPEFKGKILINGIRLTKPRKKHLSYIIREGLFTDNEVKLEILIEDGFIAFCNASNLLADYSDLPNKMTEMIDKKSEQFESKGFTSSFSASHMYGNAFWVEPLSENCYRFYCNDHQMDDDFDDLIFDLEVESFSDE